ncbi:hypothetical protein [Paramicrobacterium chengjingii]|uniref:hypothetical protein n=1 Tax=Paramicrobacterium chengjingii TaxID=2769067 RepID=UPI0014234078|nr:hypothetical protein [Microbacterium chengjingii]
MSIKQEADDYARRNIGGMQPVETVGDKVRAAYIAGASRPVTDEEAEAACIGFYNDVDGLTDWERLASTDPSLAEKYRSAIRRALETAREVRA